MYTARQKIRSGRPRVVANCCNERRVWFGVLKKQPSMNSVTRPGMQRSNTLKKQASYNNVMARLNNMDPPAPEAKRRKSKEQLSSYNNVLARFQTNDGNEARQAPIVV